MGSQTEPDRTQKMRDETIWKLIVYMAMPAICANLANAAYNIVDRMFVGNIVGRDALAAIALLLPLTNVATALSLFMTVGGAAMISLRLGAQELGDADRVFTNIVVQAVVSGGLLALGYGLFAPQLVRLCGAGADSVLTPLAVSYLRLTAIGQLFHMINLAFASLIRAQGNTRYSMFVSLIGNLINIVLDYCLIAVFALGIEGAAIATSCSQLISCVFSALYFLRGHSIVKWGGLGQVRLSVIGKIISMGFAPSVLQGLSFFSNIIVNRSLMHYGAQNGASLGELAISAVAVTNTVETFLLTIVMGVNQAVSPVVSYNYGGGLYRRARSATLTGQLLASSASVLVWAMMMGVPQVFFALFSGGDAELVAFGVQAMRKAKMGVLFLGFQTLASMYFSAIGRPKTAAIISLSRQGIFLIPSLLLLPQLLGLDGVFYATSVSDFCSVLVVGGIYLREIRKLGRMPDAQAAPLPDGRATRAAS